MGPKVQGVTGREEKRLISDNCLEVGMGEREDDSSTESENSDEEVDEDGYLVLKPTKVEEYVIPEQKKKQKTKGGSLEIRSRLKLIFGAKNNRKVWRPRLASFQREQV